MLKFTAKFNTSSHSNFEKVCSVLADNGWTEGAHGQILNDRGRTIFEIGFATAIRKVLSD